MAYSETILATLGHVTVTKSFDVEVVAGDSAYMMNTIRVHIGQTVPIKFVAERERFLYVEFAGTIVHSWDRTYVGASAPYLWFDRNTFELAKLVQSGWRGNCEVVLTPDHMVAQHEDSKGLSFYGPGCSSTGEITPMLRVVLTENKAPIGWRTCYPSRSGVDGWWYEAFM